MGNASASVIVKKYDGVPKEHTATAGHLLQWKIWPGCNVFWRQFSAWTLSFCELGICKESSSSLGTQQGDKVSVWFFDKNDLVKRKNSPITDKTVVEQMYQIFKKDFTVIKESAHCQHIVQHIEVSYWFLPYLALLMELSNLSDNRRLQVGNSLYDWENRVFIRWHVARFWAYCRRTSSAF